MAADTTPAPSHRSVSVDDDGTVTRICETPLIERIPRRIGLDSLVERDPLGIGPVRIAWVYLAVLFIVGEGTVQAIRLSTGRPPIAMTSPSWLALPFGLVFGVFGIQYVYDRYDRAIEFGRIRERTGDEMDVGTFIPRWLRAGLLGLAWTIYGGFLVANDLFVHIVEVDGLVAGALAWGILIPIGYVPIVVEFTAAFLAIQFLLPRKLVAADLRLDFLDPEGLGGLRPVGELFKQSYYLYAVGAVFYVVLTYAGPVVGGWLATPFPEPGAIEAAFFTVVWGLGIVAIGHSMLTLHRHMRIEKRDRLLELLAQHREHVESPDDILSFSIADEASYREVQHRIDRVEATNEYPATLTMWSHIAVSVVVPKLLQLLLRGL